MINNKKSARKPSQDLNKNLECFLFYICFTNFNLLLEKMHMGFLYHKEKESIV